MDPDEAMLEDSGMMPEELQDSGFESSRDSGWESDQAAEHTASSDLDSFSTDDDDDDGDDSVGSGPSSHGSNSSDASDGFEAEEDPHRTELHMAAGVLFWGLSVLCCTMLQRCTSQLTDRGVERETGGLLLPAAACASALFVPLPSRVSDP